ncbi:hypothetical protein [Olleya namhaensis]|uniref:hypothetical protein n=1 Tax=Olleya namhaensis TaxID=1144750 RepID=UPI0024912003|nr:hypothetical protein [Olleya namhaensis]
MKKRILTILTILISAISFACSCDIPKPILEFESAEYVFEGNVISKIYAKDSLTYTITFDITKHYKESDNPKNLEFTFKSESKYTGEWTSCDWSVNKDENWLVYAKYWKEKLTFGYFCSNSKPLDRRTIFKKEQNVLNNGNSFKLENYIYQSETEFNFTKPISNIDSIFRTGQIKEYERTFTVLKLYIDKKGNLISVSNRFGYQFEIDSIFNLPIEFKTNFDKPIPEFEKDAIELVENIRKWEIKRHDKTNIPVFYVRSLIITYDKEKKEWNYEL